MSKRPWRSSYIMLIKVKSDSAKFVLPLPLPLLEELLDAFAWLFYWLMKIKPNMLTILRERLEESRTIPLEWLGVSEGLLLELLKAPAIFFRALRAEGPFTLVKVDDGPDSVEIRLI